MPTGATGVQGIQGLQGPLGRRGPVGLPSWNDQPYINNYGMNATGPAGQFGAIGSIITTTSLPASTTIVPGSLTILNLTLGGTTIIPDNRTGYACFFYNSTVSEAVTFNDSSARTIGVLPPGRIGLVFDGPLLSSINYSDTSTTRLILL